MRRILKALLTNAPLGDTTSLKNPNCMDSLYKGVQKQVQNEVQNESELRSESTIEFVKSITNATVKDIIKDIIDVESIDPYTPLMQVGMKSNQAIDFSKRLGQKFGIHIPTMLVYQHSNLDAIYRYIETLLKEKSKEKSNENSRSHIQMPTQMPNQNQTQFTTMIQFATANIPGCAHNGTPIRLVTYF